MKDADALDQSPVGTLCRITCIAETLHPVSTWATVPSIVLPYTVNHYYYYLVGVVLIVALAGTGMYVPVMQLSSR